MGIMQQIMSNNRVMGNPMIKNAMSMAQSGNSKGIEQMARNLCKEKGINPDDVMKQIRVANMQNTNALQAQLANCCCETREAIQGINYNMATKIY